MCGLTIKLSYSSILRRNIKVIKHNKRPADASRPQRRGGVDPHSCRWLKSPDRNFESGVVRVHGCGESTRSHTRTSCINQNILKASTEVPSELRGAQRRKSSFFLLPSRRRVFLLSAFHFPAADPSPSRAPTSPRCRRRRPQSCKLHARRPGNWI